MSKLRRDRQKKKVRKYASLNLVRISYFSLPLLEYNRQRMKRRFPPANIIFFYHFLLISKLKFCTTVFVFTGIPQTAQGFF